MNWAGVTVKFLIVRETNCMVDYHLKTGGLEGGVL